MKKSITIFLFIFLFIFSFLWSKKEENFKKTADGVNIEMPVRVYFRDKPVDNLAKMDFKIFRGKKRQKISEFKIERKKIEIQKTGLSANQQHSLGPRFFILVFNITHFHDNLKKGLNYLFESILRDNDRLMLLINDKCFLAETLENKSKIRKRIQELLVTESKIKRDQMTAYLKHIENEINISKLKLELREMKTQFGSNPSRLNKFLTKYLEIWNTYKQAYLVPNIDNYSYVSKHFEKMNMDKWVLNFYQMELFPKIVLTMDILTKIKQLIKGWQVNLNINPELFKYAKIISRQLIEVERINKISTDFSIIEIINFFYKTNATFHVIFSRTTNPALAQNLQYNQVSSDLENCLKAIARKTGGLLITSNKIEQALETISKEEDICYFLTYTPEKSKQTGKLNVKVRNNRYKPFYDDTIGAGTLKEEKIKKFRKGPAVKIDDMIFKNNELTIIISNFHIGKSKDGRCGKLIIRISIQNRQGIDVFEQKKNLNARQKIIKLSLNIPEIKKGKYNIVVNIKDKFTDKNATNVLHFETN